jgi:uncharacterized protein YjiS (DUF1127 family)
MAYQSNLTNTAANGLVDRITALIADYRANLARRKVYRDTLRELQALGPRELNDLGMNASMIKRIAYQAAYEM